MFLITARGTKRRCTSSWAEVIVPSRATAFFFCGKGCDRVNPKHGGGAQGHGPAHKLGTEQRNGSGAKSRGPCRGSGLELRWNAGRTTKNRRCHSALC